MNGLPFSHSSQLVTFTSYRTLRDRLSICPKIGHPPCRIHGQLLCSRSSAPVCAFIAIKKSSTSFSFSTKFRRSV